MTAVGEPILKPWQNAQFASSPFCIFWPPSCDFNALPPLLPPHALRGPHPASGAAPGAGDTVVSQAGEVPVLLSSCLREGKGQETKGITLNNGKCQVGNQMG